MFPPPLPLSLKAMETMSLGEGENQPTDYVGKKTRCRHVTVKLGKTQQKGTWKAARQGHRTDGRAHTPTETVGAGFTPWEGGGGQLSARSPEEASFEKASVTMQTTRNNYWLVVPKAMITPSGGGRG